GWSMGRRLTLVTVTTLGLWLVGALVLVSGLGLLRGAGLDPVWVGWGLTFAIVVAGALACAGGVPAPRGRQRVGPGVLFMRGLLAASAIGVAVWLTDVAGRLAAGVAFVFPAIFRATMVALWLAQGQDVQAGGVGPMMLGCSAVAGFAVLAASTFVGLGPVGGSVVAWLA